MALYDTDFIWAQKYRPKNINDVILPQNLKRTFSDIVDAGEIPNMIFAGPAGVGKTTIALALADELEYDTLILNGSGDDRGIDTVKNKITQFATTMSLDGSRKLIIVDEGDNQTNDAQLALRAVIESVSSNCSFIITCNHPNRISDAIKSRCPVVTFSFPSDEKKSLVKEMWLRCADILKEHDIDVKSDNEKAKRLLHLINYNFPDFRKTLGLLQNSYRILGDIALDTADKDMQELVDAMKGGDVGKINAWIAHTTLNPIDVIIWFGDPARLGSIFKDDKTHVEAAILAAEYDYNNSFCTDQIVNLRAFCFKLTALASKKWM